MNILFYTSFDAAPQKGGTERITISVSNALRALHGHKCFLMYSVDVHNLTPAFFDGRAKLSKGNEIEQISKCLKSFSIDVVIVQGALELVCFFRNAIESTCQAKLFFVHHFAPGWEVQFFSFYNRIKRFKNATTASKKAVEFIRLCAHPLCLYKQKRALAKQYANAYYNSDKVVLLSPDFAPEFKNFGSISDSSKFEFIPNMLSYDVESTKQSFAKEKIVLIVSRLDEVQKRISVALDIWKMAKKNTISQGWKLLVIGTGDDELRYKKKVKRENINDVTFLGSQNPQKYYESAAIFLMTSKSEGWGLTLTEAQQFGTVPIAFNSYASLHDIITNGEDGVVIPEKNVALYTKHLLNLMKDEKLRKKMSSTAQNKARNFSAQAIANLWNLVISK